MRKFLKLIRFWKKKLILKIIWLSFFYVCNFWVVYVKILFISGDCEMLYNINIYVCERICIVCSDGYIVIIMFIFC